MYDFIKAASKLLADDVDPLWAESGGLVQFALGPRTHASVQSAFFLRHDLSTVSMKSSNGLPNFSKLTEPDSLHKLLKSQLSSFNHSEIAFP